MSLLLDAFFPKHCLECNALGSYICERCMHKLAPIEQQRCIVCQQSSEQGHTHQACATKLTPDRLITCFSYHNPITKLLITRGKLMLIPELFTALTGEALKIIETSGSLEKFTLAPIPTSKAKERFRGFNQSAIITTQLQTVFNIPILPLLRKRAFIKQQKLLNKTARQTNIKNAFLITPQPSLPPHILIIDDVTTSGATFLAATKILKQAGIQTVWCFALAQD